MSRGQRFAFLGLAAVVIIAAAVIIGTSGSSDDSSSKSAGPVTIRVKGEKPVGGIEHIDVNKGDPIRFTVHSDSAQEVHVHGYDIHEDIPADGQATFDFPAKIDGSFVVELEGPGVQIAALKVAP